MRTRIDHPALGLMRGAVLGGFAVALLHAAVPRTDAADCWGRLANPGFDGNRIKTTLFFAGQANDGSRQPPEDCYITPNLDKYTLNPEPRDTHLNWSNPANRDIVMNLMTNAGINVITMSSWGEDFLGCSDGWVTGSAPMQTSPQAHNELFDAVANKHLLIVPFIESRSSWAMRDEFPLWSDGRVSPGLVSQIANLIHRYLQNPGHPEWAEKWAKVYDHNGAPRYAVVLIHACSNNLPAFDDEQFAAGFDLVADEIARATGVQIGFFIDAVPPGSTLSRASFKPSAVFTAPSLRNTPSFLGIQCFAPEIFSGESGDDDLLSFKRGFISDWFATGIPVLVDVSPGYDGHLVFGDDAKGAYGHSDEWIQGVTALVNEYGRAGMVYNSWNGYTEAMVGTPTTEKGNSLYDWLKALNSDQGVYVDHTVPGIGQGTVFDPFQTVAAGVAEACKGDLIHIRSGSYPEAMTVGKPLTLQARQGPVTIGP